MFVSRYVLVLQYLAIAGNAPFGQSHLCYPFIYSMVLLPPPLLPRAPMTKYI